MSEALRTSRLSLDVYLASTQVPVRLSTSRTLCGAHGVSRAAERNYGLEGILNPCLLFHEYGLTMTCRDTGYRSVPELPEEENDYDEKYNYPTCPAFKEIGDLRGPFDLGLIPIGAYDPRFIMSPM